MEDINKNNYLLLWYICAQKLLQICQSWDWDKGKWTMLIIVMTIFLISWTENSCEGGKI